MAELRDLLERATDGIEPRGGAADALRTARRRRTRQRGTAAVLASAVAVAAVVVGVRLATGGTGESAPPPAESPTATVLPSTAPEIDPARTQAVWDPRGAEQLPVTDLGVPRVMPTAPAGTIDRPPVALLDDGTRILAVGADGAAVTIEPPEGVDAERTTSLAPDGTRVVVVGPTEAFWRDVNSPTWRAIQVELVPGGLGDAIVVEWAGSSTVMLRGDGRTARVDLDTGAVVTLPDGFTVDDSTGSVGERMSRPVSGRSAVAGAWSGGPRGGLVAVERTTGKPRALLPVRADSDHLTPVAWLDDDTVAFTVQPPGAPKEYLVTWNVETGELSRISCWLTSFRASLATGLLG